LEETKGGSTKREKGHKRHRHALTPSMAKIRDQREVCKAPLQGLRHQQQWQQLTYRAF